MARASADYRITAHDEASRALGKIRGNLGLTGRAFGIMATAAVSALAAVSFTGIARELVEYGDQVHKATIRTGFGAEALTKLYHAGRLSDVGIGTINKSLFRMQRSTGDAARGLKEQTDAFRDLNIDVGKFAALKPEEQFRVLVGRLAAVDDKARLAVDGNALFGRSFEELIPLIEGGTKALDDYNASAERTGVQLTDDQALAAAAASDAWTRFGDTVQGQQNQALPTLAKWSRAVADIGAVAIPAAVDALTDNPITRWWDKQTTIAGAAFSSGVALIAGNTEMAADLWDAAFDRIENGAYDAFAGVADAATGAAKTIADVSLAAPGGGGGPLGELGFIDPFTDPRTVAQAQASVAATERIERLMSVVKSGMAERTGLDGQRGQFGDLGLARIATGGPGLGITRPQKIESDQLELAVQALREILAAVKADKITVFG